MRGRIACWLGLMVTGWPVADVAVLFGSHVDIHRIEPDAAYQDALLTIAIDWWERCIVRDEPPAVDGSEATRQALLRLYPSDGGELMEPTAELEALMREWREWREARPAAKAAVEREDRIKNAVRLALGEHAGAESDLWRVSNRRTKDSARTDWKSVAAAYREVIEQERSGVRRIDDLDVLESLHTQPVEGYRALKPWWSGEEEAWT